MCSVPYANWYANQPDSGGVRGCTPTYAKRSDLQKLDTHEHRRTHCLNLGVKWSQVQILSARRRSDAISRRLRHFFAGADPND